MYNFSKYDFIDNAEELKQNFNEYCNWCWGHGYGDCDVCKEKLKIRLDELECERGEY